MKQNNFKSLIGTAALCATLGLSSTANAVVTAPVGYVQLTFNAESDTSFSLPMNRPMVYSGQNSGVSGNVISIANADFVANEFVYEFTDDDNNDNDQRERYYVIFTSGTLEGRTFDITANTATTITVDPDYTGTNSDDLESLINSLSSNDTFQVRPHWTLNTMFPDGGVLPVSPNLFQANGSILGFSPTQIGTNNSASNIYIYVDSDGWYDNLTFQRADDEVLRREAAYIFRNTSSEVLEANVMGDVPTVDQHIAFNQHVVQTDSLVSSQFPIDLSLEDLGLAGTSGFTSSSSIFVADGSQLIVNGNEGFNTSAEHIYIHVDDQGWFDSLTLSPAPGDVIEAGKSFIIRSAPTGAVGGEIIFHSVDLPYNPFAE